MHNGSPILVIRPSKDGAYDFHVFNPDGAKRQINLWYENEHYEYLQGKALQETKAEWSPAPHHGFRSGVKQRASLAKSVYESSANRTVRTSQPKTAASSVDSLCGHTVRGAASSSKSRAKTDSLGGFTVRPKFHKKPDSLPDSVGGHTFAKCDSVGGRTVQRASSVKSHKALSSQALRPRVAQSNTSVCATSPRCPTGSSSQKNRPDSPSSAAAADPVWVCDECQQPITASDVAKLSQARYRHISQHHGLMPLSRFHRLYEPSGIIAASKAIQWEADGWECAGCEARLAPIANRHQKMISVVAHLKNCSEVRARNKNATSNRIALIREFGGTTPLVRALKPGKGGMKRTNLALHKIASQFRELQDLQQHTNHVLHRVERNSDEGRHKVTLQNVAYTCSHCLQVWKWAIGLSPFGTSANSTCLNVNSQKGCSSTRQFYRKGSTPLQRDLQKIWKLTQQEKKSFSLVREALRKHCGKAGPRAEQHGSRRAAVIAGRRNDRALWISGHLRMACRAKVVQEGIEV